MRSLEMETIPTPRTDAENAKCGLHGDSKELHGNFAARLNLMIHHSQQLERELTIAKRALEEISFGVPIKTEPGGCGQIELTKIQLQTIADMSLAKLNTLSA